MYGGVSLAVYISAVANELLRIVQGRGPYALMKWFTQSSAVVDVISGTSAGSINGVFLGYALTHGGTCRPLDHARGPAGMKTIGKNNRPELHEKEPRFMRTIAQLFVSVLLIVAPPIKNVAAAASPTPDCTAKRHSVSPPDQTNKQGYKTLTAQEIKDALVLKPGRLMKSPHGAEWRDRVVKERLDLHHSIIPVAVSFENVVFAGPVLLSQSSFPRGLNITKSTFLDTVDLSYAEVGSQLLAKNVYFLGPVNMSGIKINGDFILKGTRFADAADLSAMTVAGWLGIRDTCFWKEVDISDSGIAKGFDARRAQFLSSSCVKNGSPKPCSDFSSMSIGGTVDIREALFQGGLDFSFTTTGGLFMARDAEFVNKTDFSYMTVRGLVSLLRTRFDSDLALEHSAFASLDLSCSSVLPPSSACSGSPGGGSLAIDGMKYESISAGPDERAWEGLVGFVQRAKFSAPAYSLLESFFRQQGYGDRGNAVRVRGQRAYRATLHPLQAPWKDAGPWLGNGYTDLTSSYGTHNERPLIWLALLILICFLFVFRPKYFEQSDKPCLEKLYEETGLRVRPRASYPFNRLLYSLSVLVPGFRFYDPSTWVEKAEYRWVGYIRTGARVLAWIFIGVYALNTAGPDILRRILP